MAYEPLMANPAPLKGSEGQMLTGLFTRLRKSRVVAVAAFFFIGFFLTEKLRSSPSSNTSSFRIFGFSSQPRDYQYLRNVIRPGSLVVTPKNRKIDTSDAFSDFYRLPQCYLSSLDLHEPFHPLCTSQEDVMNAMSDGGRAGGFDAPYMPRGCDMRWFNNEEVCEIMSRFDKIHIIGDSMMRNLAVGVHTLLRKSLVYGGQAQWVDQPEGYDCTCAGPFSYGNCIWASAFSSSHIWEHDPGSMSCPRDNSALVEFNPKLRFPLDNGGRDLADELPDTKPAKPQIFIFGHGIWNNMTFSATEGWAHELLDVITEKNPWLAEPDAFFPKLFVTTSAAGIEKPEAYYTAQGNLKILRFEKEVRAWAPSIGAQFLGLYNLTIQNTSPDGTHAGMRANLAKAMMVMNWLSWIDVSNYRA